MNCSITDFGAIGDGIRLETETIQKALDACASSGGGVVIIPAGEYRIGTIYLRSNVELHLESGALLKASHDLNDYNKEDAYPQNWHSDQEQWNASHLIIGVGIEDASITGQGTIDGGAAFFFAENESWRDDLVWRYGIRMAKDKERLRPGQMIVFVECRNVSVFDVKLQNSPCWTLFFHGCENVVARGLRITNPKYHANTDGIDIDSCRNAVISDCIIDTGDDAIAIRGSNKRLLDKSKCCENITVTNCVLTTAVCGFRIGVGTGTIRNVAISNIVMPECGQAVLVQSVYNNATVKGVDISDLRVANVIANCSVPVHIQVGTEQSMAEIRNISFEHCSFRCFHNLILEGSSQSSPTGISFSNVDFTVIDSPAPYKHREVPEHLLTMKKVSDVSLSNVRIHWQTQASNWKSALKQEDVSGLEISGRPLAEPIVG